MLDVNFAAGNGDGLVGGAMQTGDGLGRRLARSHASDAVDLEMGGVPGGPAAAHANCRIDAPSPAPPCGPW